MSSTWPRRACFQSWKCVLYHAQLQSGIWYAFRQKLAVHCALPLSLRHRYAPLLPCAVRAFLISAAAGAVRGVQCGARRAVLGWAGPGHPRVGGCGRRAAAPPARPPWARQWPNTHCHKGAHMEHRTDHASAYAKLVMQRPRRRGLLGAWAASCCADSAATAMR